MISERKKDGVGGSLTNKEHIYFVPGSPFYDMILSHMTALSTVSFILNNKKLIDLKEKDYVSIEGKYVNGRHFFPYDVIKIIETGFFPLSSFINSSCCMLANTAYETVKNENDKSPEFELLRHIRNASSHGNSFTFRKNEPSSPSYWKDAFIDHTTKGKSNPLNGTQCFGQFIGPTDIVDLLKEIENKII